MARALAVVFYRSIRLLFRLLALPLFAFGVRGARRVPRCGPGVVVAAHRSWLDPACVAGACPRPVRFLMMERLYRRSWARWFYRGMRAIPVEAEDGRGSLRGVREGLRALRQGQLVGIFPEGRVFPADRPGILHPGAALLAIRGQAPVIPCGIVGSDRAWPHGRGWPGPARVRVRFGEPILPPVRQDRESLERFMQRIEAELRRLGQTEASG